MARDRFAEAIQRIARGTGPSPRGAARSERSFSGDMAGYSGREPRELAEDETAMPGGGYMPMDDLRGRRELTPALVSKARPDTAAFMRSTQAFPGVRIRGDETRGIAEDEVALPGTGYASIDDLERTGQMTPALMRKARPDTTAALEAGGAAPTESDRLYDQYVGNSMDRMLRDFAMRDRMGVLDATVDRRAAAERARERARVLQEQQRRHEELGREQESRRHPGWLDLSEEELAQLDAQDAREREARRAAGIQAAQAAGGPAWLNMTEEQLAVLDAADAAEAAARRAAGGRR